MKQLGVSTSTDTLSLAVFEEKQSLASVTLNSRRKHGELLLEAIHDLLKHMSWSATDLDEIYIDVGPGSYTGLRIGVTMAKTWAFANEAAIYSLSSMALQASNLIDTPRANDLVVSLMDSRRNTAYTGVYEICDGKVRERIPDQHVEWENFLEDIHDQLEDHSGVTFVGDKIDEFVEQFRARYPRVSVTDLQGWQSLPQVDRLFLTPYHQVENPEILAPNYALETLAVREWAAREHVDLTKEDESGYVDRV